MTISLVHDRVFFLVDFSVRRRFAFSDHRVVQFFLLGRSHAFGDWSFVERDEDVLREKVVAGNAAFVLLVRPGTE